MFHVQFGCRIYLLSHVIFKAAKKFSICDILNPPFDMSLTINFRFILSGPQFQIKLKHNLFSDFTKSAGGFGKAKNR